MPVRLRILPARAGAEGPPVERAVEIAGPVAEIRIGRRPDLELPLPFPALSAVHARIWREGATGPWLVEDLGSTNGTTLAGRPLEPGQARALAAGDELALAHLIVLFDGESGPEAAPEAPAGRQPGAAGKPDGTGTIARRLVGDLFASAPNGAAPELEVMAGPEPGRRLALRESHRPYLAGRGEGCDLPLVVEEISREHAAFIWRSEGVVVRDLVSKNGVLVGGARVAGEQRLHDGDLVALGPATLRLHDPVDRYLADLERAPAPSAVAPAVPPIAEDAEPPAPEAAPPRPPARAGNLMIAIALTILAALAAAAIALFATHH